MSLRCPCGVLAAECRVRPPVGDLFFHLGPCGHHGSTLGPHVDPIGFHLGPICAPSGSFGANQGSFGAPTYLRKITIQAASMSRHVIIPCHVIITCHHAMTCRHDMTSCHAMASRHDISTSHVMSESQKLSRRSLDALTVPEALVNTIRILEMFSTSLNPPQA